MEFSGTELVYATWAGYALVVLVIITLIWKVLVRTKNPKS